MDAQSSKGNLDIHSGGGSGYGDEVHPDFASDNEDMQSNNSVDDDESRDELVSAMDGRW